MIGADQSGLFPGLSYSSAISVDRSTELSVYPAGSILMAG